jgi:hypothetical protein
MDMEQMMEDMLAGIRTNQAKTPNLKEVKAIQEEIKAKLY